MQSAAGRHLKVAERNLADGGYNIKDQALLEGLVVAELFDEEMFRKDLVVVKNIITEVGDEYYGERAAGIGTPPNQVSGGKLGTGTTAASKTGAGAHIVTYLSGSHVAVAGGFPTSALSSGKRRIQWKFSWAAGVATNSAISEAIITGQSSLANDAGNAADTYSRTVFSPVIDKQSGDSLDVTWSHDLGTP